MIQIAQDSNRVIETNYHICFDSEPYEGSVSETCCYVLSQTTKE